MPQLPAPFPTPDWGLDPANYPSVFVIDKPWVIMPDFSFETRSLPPEDPAGNNPFDTPKETDNHGGKTLHIISSIARELPKNKITLVNIDRRNELADIQNSGNLPEAILSIQANLKPGDLLVINVGANSGDGQDSFVRDPLVANLLNDTIDLFGGIVVLSAGNAIKPLSSTQLSGAVTVGGVSSNGEPLSRFGSFLTCYGVVPFKLPGTNVDFGHSSAATAYTAGQVLMMLNYARSKGMTLASNQVVDLLKTNFLASALVSVLDDPNLGNPGSLPDWNKLRSAIDAMVV